MMLARYHGQPAAFLGATRYQLVPELEELPAEHPDRRRVETACAIALEVRRLTGIEIGREPRPDPRRL